MSQNKVFLVFDKNYILKINKLKNPKLYSIRLVTKLLNCLSKILHLSIILILPDKNYILVIKTITKAKTCIVFSLF